MRSALTVAGSDSVGGAGIQADIKAMTSVGVHAATVITAITAQNTCRVSDIMPVPADMIQSQLDAVLKDCRIEAVKTGMLYNAETVKIVADALEDHEVPLVVDPVMAATVGDALSDNTLVRALKEKLLPMCELVTPNKHEAEILANMEIKNEDDAMFACEIIGKQGSSVLLKGGHMDTRNVIDYLYLSSEFTELKNKRLNTAGHGSGCALSAFITANMAKGLDLVNAVLRSRELIQEAIATQYSVGKGELIVNPTGNRNEDPVRFKVLDQVDSAAERIVDLLPHELVPKEGMNIAFAMPGATGSEDVAAIDRRISIHNGMIVKNGPAKFGAAEHLSYVVLESMKINPNIRCAMNIAFTIDSVNIMEEVGFTISRYDRKNDHTIADMTKNAITHSESFPDAITDSGTGKNDKTIRILGKDPEDVMSKLESIL